VWKARPRSMMSVNDFWRLRQPRPRAASGWRSMSTSSPSDISLAPSGALELEWDNGKQVGVGQVIGDVLAVACLSKGRTMILTMNINPDGSLSGRWSRRTDRGTQGTETWTKT
jgi:hypothetical protein